MNKATAAGGYHKYGCTPEQYHAGVSKLWAALEIKSSPTGDDVFTLAAARILSEKHHRVEHAIYRDIARNQTMRCVELRDALEYSREIANGTHQAFMADRCDSIRILIDKVLPMENQKWEQ